jgi:hypothetical protein
LRGEHVEATFGGKAQSALQAFLPPKRNGAQ